jgi:hypothetical protein
MHGFFLGGYILTLGFFITTFGMALWFKDIITEATILTCFNNYLFKNDKNKNRNMVIIKEMFQYFIFSNILSIFNFLLFKSIRNYFNKSDCNKTSIINSKILKFYSNEEFSFYLASLFEEDGSIN